MSFDFALINNDLKLLPSGDVKTVRDSQKLRQDILKIIVTPAGSNKFHMWYGCTVGEDVIGKNLPNNMFTMDIQISISNSLNRLMSLQKQQQSNQAVSLAELIDNIASVVAERSTRDYRQVVVKVIVYSKRLTKIEEIFTLEA